MKRTRILPAIFAAPLFALTASATVQDLDSNASNGLFPVPGGTWDWGNTAVWTTDAGETRHVWSSNDDTLQLTLPANAWANVTVTVDSSLGAVGAKGIVVTGELPDWKEVHFEGDAFTLGADGFTERSTNPNVFVYLNAPMTLSASQTWSTRTKRAMSGCGTVVVGGALSGAADTVLALDGLGMVDPGIRTLSNTLRPGFKFSAGNNLAGPLVVRNGAMLWLSYTAAAPASRFGSANHLVLEGGSVWMTGNATTFTQDITALVLRKGSNILCGNNANGVYHIHAIERDGKGGTLDFPVSWNGGASATLDDLAQNAFVGGWATMNGTMWAKMGANGAVGGDNGTQRVPSAWTDGVNAQVHGGGVCPADVSPNTLRFTTAAEVDLGTATVTLQSGGLMSYSNPTTLKGGTLRTGMATGELFVHANTDIACASAFADKDDVPGSLVKGGPAALVLSGDFGFTGETYLNAGTLSITGEAALSAPVVQAGGTTLSVSDGGTLAPSSVWTLDGSLALGDGAALALPLVPKATAPITLSNEFAVFSGTVAAEGVSLALSFPEGVPAKRGAYPLIAWTDGTTLTDVSAAMFDVDVPAIVRGSLAVDGNALVYTVDSVLLGTRILVL